MSNSKRQTPASLTQHGLKRVCESAKTLSTDMAGVTLVVQVVDATIFGPEQAKKNIKGRVTLSDGVSRVLCMLPEKTYNAMVSFDSIQKWETLLTGNLISL